MDAVDVAHTLDFLTAIFQGTPDGTLWLTSLPQNGGEPFSLASRDHDAISDFLFRHNGQGRSSYFCPNALRNGATGRDKAAVEFITGLHADIDFKDHDKSSDEIRRIVDQAALQASLVIQSGGGLHAYWLFHEGLEATPDKVVRVETLLRALAAHLGGDPAVAHSAALMRLPGTWNPKRQPHALVRIVESRPAARYEIEDLEDWLSAARPILTRKAPTTATDAFAAYAAGAGAHVDADAELAAMTCGDGLHGVHHTQTRVIASMIARGATLDEITDKVLAATKAAHARSNQPAWDWNKEARSIRKSAETFFRKKAFEAEATETRAPQRELIKSSAEFTAGFVPPDYLVDDWLQRQFFYSFTAKTGGGKTALMLLFAAHVALGRPIGDRNVAKGKVLYFSGENSTDVCMRWIAMGKEEDFDVNNVDVFLISERVKISEVVQRVRSEIETKIGEVALILIDTSAAYFEGNDENDNPQAGNWARTLRSLTSLPGGPFVLAACHPTKNAADDNLLPRGGGAFVNEVDGNLTARKDDQLVEMHWQGKFRGPEFAPASFQLRLVTHERLEDSKGRLLSTVIAEPLTEAAEKEIVQATRSEEDQLLQMLADHPTASLSELASLLGWLTKAGQPYKSKIQKRLEKLAKAKLVSKDRGSYTIAPKGEKLLGKEDE